jgi:hypothetical protein
MPALRAIATLAHAMEAELAARFIEDRRLSDALAFATHGAGEDSKASLRHVERNLRRAVESVAAHDKIAWSFDIAQCSGIFAAECALHPDDLLAIALPEVEQMMGILREEIVTGLARTSGVLLMPRHQPAANRPIVGMIMREASLNEVVDAGVDIATRTRQPLAFVVASELLAHVRKAVAGQWTGPGAVALHPVPTAEMEFLAAQVRSLRPRLVVAAPPKAIIAELLARPRLLREVGAPILLLPFEGTD